MLALVASVLPLNVVGVLHLNQRFEICVERAKSLVDLEEFLKCLS
jgi:hypothetical protein